MKKLWLLFAVVIVGLVVYRPQINRYNFNFLHKNVTELKNDSVCLAKDDTFKSSDEQIQMMEKLGINCATVYWKLTSSDNLKHPYSWVQKKYLDRGYQVNVVLIIDDKKSSNVAMGEGLSKESGGNLDDVLTGKYDDALKQLSKVIASDNRPVTIRPFHEFNGRWFAWAMYTEGNSPDKLVAAFNHVITLFKDAGAENVKFDANVSRRDANLQILADAHVYTELSKLVNSFSISTYNRGGTSAEYAEDQSFIDGFLPTYERFVSLIPAEMPINVAEVSTAGLMSPKLPWFEAMFSALSNVPRTKQTTLFFGEGTAIGGGKISWGLNDTEYDQLAKLIKQWRNK